MRQIYLLVAAAFLVAAPASGQVIFSQDFSSSNTVTDYVSSTPTNGQWNAIGASGAGTTVSITGGALTFTRTGNAGSFSRTTDFSPTPTAVIYQFDLSVSGNTTAQTTAATFQIGSGFGTANSAQANADVHSRIGLNLTATTGTFQLRDIGSGTVSTSLSGTQSIFWVVNNSGAALSYTAPDASVHSLANDTADVWAGNSIVLTALGATTATQSLSDLKFVFSAGAGTIALDNFAVTAVPEPSTYAAMAGAAVLLATVWQRRRAARRGLAGTMRWRPDLSRGRGPEGETALP